ncbi:hypothetical protein FF1_007825 [Malus domestica]
MQSPNPRSSIPSNTSSTSSSTTASPPATPTLPPTPPTSTDAANRTTTSYSSLRDNMLGVAVVEAESTKW